jgi:hypothetical protein
MDLLGRFGGLTKRNPECSMKWIERSSPEAWKQTTRLASTEVWNRTSGSWSTTTLELPVFEYIGDSGEESLSDCFESLRLVAFHEDETKLAWPRGSRVSLSSCPKFSPQRKKYTSKEEVVGFPLLSPLAARASLASFASALPASGLPKQAKNSPLTPNRSDYNSDTGRRVSMNPGSEWEGWPRVTLLINYIK